MEYLFAAIAITLAVLAYLIQREARKGWQDTFSEFRAEREALIKEHRDEMRELLNRYQFPERMPTREPQQGRVNRPDPELRRKLNQVGKVAPQVSDAES